MWLHVPGSVGAAPTFPCLKKQEGVFLVTFKSLCKISPYEPRLSHRVLQQLQWVWKGRFCTTWCLNVHAHLHLCGRTLEARSTCPIWDFSCFEISLPEMLYGESNPEGWQPKMQNNQKTFPPWHENRNKIGMWFAIHGSAAQLRWGSSSQQTTVQINIAENQPSNLYRWSRKLPILVPAYPKWPQMISACPQISSFLFITGKEAQNVNLQLLLDHHCALFIYG